MATHSIMRVGQSSQTKDSEGNSLDIVSLTDYVPREFTVKLKNATEQQKSELRALKDKVALVPTMEGAMNGNFWMSLRTGIIMPLPTAPK